jgi:N-methylhydantoinase B
MRTLDYASGIADAQGRLADPGQRRFWIYRLISPMICAVADKLPGKLHPGMCIIINDPLSAAARTCRMWGWSWPIFYRGELIAFLGTRPIGANRSMAPGSFTTDATNHLSGGHVLFRGQAGGPGELVEPYGMSCAATCGYPQISQGDIVGDRSPRCAPATSGSTSCVKNTAPMW